MSSRVSYETATPKLLGRQLLGPGGIVPEFRKVPVMGMFLSPATRRLAGVGVELAGGALGFGAIGYLADRSIGWQTPWLAVAGVLLGFALGMYRLIRMANEISQRYDRSASGIRGRGDGQGSGSPTGSESPVDRTEAGGGDRRGEATHDGESGQGGQSGQARGPG